MHSESLRSAVAIADAVERQAAATEFARIAGAEDLILFVRDSVVSLSLPAPGFPQTLRNMSLWQKLLTEAIAQGSSDGTVTTAAGAAPARAVGCEDGTVAVLIGGTPHNDCLSLLSSLLPMYGALFRAEAAATTASVDATMARHAAAQSSDLASKLDRVRSELQRALEVAESATRVRDEFLATVSHELRTPLTSIIGWVQLLRDDRDWTSVEEGLETIGRNARAQSRLIEDILDFSRINAGKLRLDVGATDLVDVIGSAIEIVRLAADAKGITIDTILNPTAGQVSGDADRLQQVVWNLLSNAVKFTQRGGAVKLRLERDGSDSVLTVMDNGEGIAPDFLPFVFDRFSQGDSSSSRSHGGLGLGLGIVRHLVELHGGRVHAESDGPGKGAAFIVRLPLRAAGVSAAGEKLSAAHPGDASKGRALEGAAILIVEDYDDSRKLLKTILTRAGAVVEEAENVDAALRSLNRFHPDLILSDIEMPGEDGYSLIRRIRAMSTLVHTPAIALTAYTQTVDRVRALAAGFQMHMGKPVEPAELVAAARSLLATRSLDSH